MAVSLTDFFSHVQFGQDHYRRHFDFKAGVTSSPLHSVCQIQFIQNAQNNKWKLIKEVPCVESDKLLQVSFLNKHVSYCDLTEKSGQIYTKDHLLLTGHLADVTVIIIILFLFHLYLQILISSQSSTSSMFFFHFDMDLEPEGKKIARRF